MAVSRGVSIVPLKLFHIGAHLFLSLALVYIFQFSSALGRSLLEMVAVICLTLTLSSVTPAISQPLGWGNVNSAGPTMESQRGRCGCSSCFF